ncbi:MAG TPA: polysaccharide deacetylase family protein [Solirubrobacteraceae bacterium]|nr:polysaccharide deacetylase family protein [Solirubrobacteraceae bacterium]
MASIDVVICVTGSGVGCCLDAVAAQRPARVWLALVDCDEAEDRAAVAAGDACTAQIRVLRSSGPGLAAARNAALAASDADVLAFVEDDVVVAADWLAALRGAWDAAPARVAAIGGPIVLDLPGQPPPWFGEALYPSYATLDYGSEAIALDPAARTLHGGNLSVRCAPLRMLGGFWPARGHGDGRDWFSEEHHAQRELAQAGWEVRYEPAARVSRVPAAQSLTPGRLLRRRWRYGARMAVADDRSQPAAVALTQALSSAAGAAAAAARRHPALALERAARATQNLGSLVGKPLAARDFRVTGPRPFHHGIQRAPPVRKRRVPAASATASATILLYHRVAESTNGSDGMCVAPERFAEQLEQIAAHPVVGLDELVELSRAKRVPDGAVAVTFDDGYQDVLVNAEPALVAAGIPATIFVSTGQVASQKPFFWDELERLILGDGARPPQLTLTFPDGRRAWRTDSPELRHRARRDIHHLIQPACVETIDAVLAELAAWAATQPSPDGPRPMTRDELRTLARSPLVSLGAHTRWHTNLGFQDEHGQREEIERSRDDLREWLGVTPVGFAYPFGIPGVDFHASTRRLVADAGFGYAVANHPGGLDTGSDPFAIPRHFVPDVAGEAFSQWLRVRLRAGV